MVHEIVHHLAHVLAHRVHRFREIADDAVLAFQRHALARSRQPSPHCTMPPTAASNSFITWRSRRPRSASARLAASRCVGSAAPFQGRRRGRRLCDEFRRSHRASRRTLSARIAVDAPRHVRYADHVRPCCRMIVTLAERQQHEARTRREPSAGRPARWLPRTAGCCLPDRLGHRWRIGRDRQSPPDAS